MHPPYVRLARALAPCALALMTLAACDRDGIDARPLGPLPTHPGSGVSDPIGQPAFGPISPVVDVIEDADAAPSDVPIADVPLTDAPNDLGPGVEPFPGDAVAPFPGDAVAPFPGDAAGPFPGDAVGPFPGDAVAPFPGPDDDEVPPAQGAAFLDWLRDGFYLQFPFVTDLQLSQAHGPIRVFMNETLATSRAAGGLPGPANQHPEGAAVVAEQFAPGTLQFLGWLAIVKTQPDSQSGLGWFWVQSSPLGPPAIAQPGAGSCLGCHSVGDDFILSNFPPAP